MTELASIKTRIMESFAASFSAIQHVPPPLVEELTKLLSETKPKAEAVVTLFEKHSEEQVRDSD